MTNWFTQLFHRENPQLTLAKFSEELFMLHKEMKELRNDLDKLEIKALESRKIYKKKLQQAFGDDESSESSGNAVLLPER